MANSSDAHAPPTATKSPAPETQELIPLESTHAARPDKLDEYGSLIRIWIWCPTGCPKASCSSVRF